MGDEGCTDWVKHGHGSSRSGWKYEHKIVSDPQNCCQMQASNVLKITGQTMTLTSDRATKELYEKYISMIKRVTTKTMGGFSPAHPLNHQQTAQGGGWLPKVVENIANMKQKW